ncbi:MAG: HAD family hydrolase [Actinobacteria bacterium]|nr:HAD family hydrolase [Actinomycetota bacterium]
MTPAASGTANLGAIVARTRYLLLDFDGPICSIFAGLPAPTVAEKLRKLIPADRLPDEIKHSSDPIEVFTYSATVSPALAERVEAKMADLEVAATATATPTPYVHEVMASCRQTSRIIGVVSNNSTRAVTAYLDRHGLSDYVALVIGRTNPDPALLKPSPHLIETVISGLQADRAASALVGDSLTDVEAAHHAGIASIGYANKPGKHDRMTQARAESVINSMAELALSLRSRHLRDLRFQTWFAWEAFTH